MATMERIAAQVLCRGWQVEWNRHRLPGEASPANTAVFHLSARVLFGVPRPFPPSTRSCRCALAIILIAPLPCASVSATWRGPGQQTSRTQIGFITLTRVAAKNACSSSEFAKQQQEEGRTASRRRRGRAACASGRSCDLVRVPSWACCRLARRDGPGAEMRQALGTAVFSGMLGVTLFGSS